jgi:hypothetical protein
MINAQAQAMQSWAAQLARQAQQSAQYAKQYSNQLRDAQVVQDKLYQTYTALQMSQSGLSTGGIGGYAGSGGFGGFSGAYSNPGSYYPGYSPLYGSATGLSSGTGSRFSLGLGVGINR